MPPLMATSRGPTLVRDLNLAHAAAINAGTIIGTGIFIESIAASVVSPGAILSVWAVASLLALLAAFTYAELGAAMPAAGGDYVYIREAFGRPAGFLFGWTQLLVARSGSIAALATGFAIYLGNFLPLEVWSGRLAALGAVGLLTAVNIAGVRMGGNVQVFFTVLKAGALALLVALAFGSEHGASENFAPLLPPEIQIGFIGLFGLALVDALWAYDGFNDLNLAAGEVSRPERNIPRAMFGSIALVMLLYVVANLAYLRFLGLLRPLGSRPGSTAQAQARFEPPLSQLGLPLDAGGLRRGGSRTHRQYAVDGAEGVGHRRAPHPARPSGFRRLEQPGPPRRGGARGGAAFLLTFTNI
jgi:amino acid transporter